jgi:membrane protease YdiL (CAAX protease family)
MNKIKSFYPTLGLSWAVVGMFLAGTLGVSLLLAVIQMFVKFPVGQNSWALLISYIIPFLVVAGLIYLLQYNAPATGVAQENKKLPPLLFILLLLFTPALSIIIEPLTAWLPMPGYIKNLFDSAFQKNLPTFLMAVVAAPVCEEWLCRGVIAKGLLRHSTPTKAIVWSAFIFAFIHINPWQAVPAFIIGLLLGYVYWKTQSLLPCIFIHFVNNGFSFVLLYLFPDIDANASSQDVLGAHYDTVYHSAQILLAGVGYALYRVLNKSEKRPHL